MILLIISWFIFSLQLYQCVEAFYTDRSLKKLFSACDILQTYQCVFIANLATDLKPSSLVRSQSHFHTYCPSISTPSSNATWCKVVAQPLFIPNKYSETLRTFWQYRTPWVTYFFSCETGDSIHSIPALVSALVHTHATVRRTLVSKWNPSPHLRRFANSSAPWYHTVKCNVVIFHYKHPFNHRKMYSPFDRWSLRRWLRLQLPLVASSIDYRTPVTETHSPVYGCKQAMYFIYKSGIACISEIHFIPRCNLFSKRELAHILGSRRSLFLMVCTSTLL